MAALRSSIAVITGVATGAAFLGLMELTVRLIPEASPWNLTISSILTSLSSIVPGFTAGVVAVRRGFLIGAAAGVLTSILFSTYANLIAPRSVIDLPPTDVLPAELTWAALAVVVGGISGIAGAAVRREGWNAF